MNPELRQPDWRKPLDPDFDAHWHELSVVSSGAYQYQCNAELLPIAEPWVIYRNGAGERLVCAERDASAFGSHFWVRSWCSLQAQYVQVHWLQTLGQQEHLIEAQYNIDQQSIHMVRWVDGVLDEQEQLQAKMPLVSPLMRVYVGQTLRDIHQQGGEASVFMPWIHDPMQLEQLLKIQVSKRRVKALGQQWLEEGNISCNCYSYLGDQYDESTVFWVDANNYLRRYCWQQNEQQWQVDLILND